ncbi:hypothetical protein [Bacillus thuringiensis]|uniref:hypothetical protein n=1 Tax=Bacillus thuringiensis TaxID=1428 RepID=UPI0011248538|nr:hypothetical protein [Bacillus thuringiensis]MRB07801.1 hypothetical protein [Bacillus thuringiensis]HDX9691978.1 hypothetical protein [Bacillus thuringiensis]
MLPADKELHALYFNEGQSGGYARCVADILSLMVIVLNIAMDVVMKFERDKHGNVCVSTIEK